MLATGYAKTFELVLENGEGMELDATYLVTYLSSYFGHDCYDYGFCVYSQKKKKEQQKQKKKMLSDLYPEMSVLKMSCLAFYLLCGLQSAI